MAQIKYLESNTDHLYNDGDQVENDILQYVKEDNGEGYWDILNQDHRWPVFYHLTDMRENILNWYDFKPEAEILEIGAGMGALTGLLCKKAKQVVSVELTPRRAEVIYNRHKQYDNLTILVGNFNKMDFSRKFDYITLIGVLEYAPGFTLDGEPSSFIRKIKSLLKPGGKLLIAIENRFGLKYWCGAGEDHTGKPYDGINGYPENKAIRTFSRNELAEMLNECGLQHQRFYYPLPDYKLPQVIYSDEYLPKDKISSKIRQYYLGEPLLLADEGKLYGDVARNDAFPFMANSFFVECSAGEATEKHPVFALFTPDRKEEYRITTVIYSDDTVRKYAACPQGQDHLQRVYEQQSLYKGKELVPYQMADGCLEMPLIHADGTLEDILCRLIRNGETAKVRQWTDRFYQVILHSSDLTGEGKERVLQHGFIDLTFENCFVAGDQFMLFDQEWMEDHLSPDFILYHAIRVLYWQNPDLEDYIPFNTMALFCLGEKKNIAEFDRKNIEILLKVYSGDKNALYYLDANKGKMEYDLLMKQKNYEQEKETVCSFFFDDGSGFSEENSRKIKVDTSLPTIHITEDIPVPGGCKSIRIDPCEGLQCAVYNISFIFNGKELAYQAVNGFHVKDMIVFPTEDPQLLVSLPQDAGLCLRAEMSVRFYSPRDLLPNQVRYALESKDRETEEKIRAISNEHAAREQELEQQLAGMRKTYAHKLIEKAEEFEENLRNVQGQIEDKNKYIQLLQEQIDDKNKYIQLLQKQVNDIAKSFFWKITKPARVIWNLIKKCLKR